MNIIFNNSNEHLSKGKEKLINLYNYYLSEANFDYDFLCKFKIENITKCDITFREKMDIYRKYFTYDTENYQEPNLIGKINNEPFIMYVENRCNNECLITFYMNDRKIEITYNTLSCDITYYRMFVETKSQDSCEKKYYLYYDLSNNIFKIKFEYDFSGMKIVNLEEFQPNILPSNSRALLKQDFTYDKRISSVRENEKSIFLHKRNSISSSEDIIYSTDLIEAFKEDSKTPDVIMTKRIFDEPNKTYGMDDENRIDDEFFCLEGKFYEKVSRINGHNVTTKYSPKQLEKYMNQMKIDYTFSSSFCRLCQNGLINIEMLDNLISEYLNQNKRKNNI